MCENHLRSQSMTTEAILHESLHAFDDFRAVVDWKNCVHHACSEVFSPLQSSNHYLLQKKIRTANLSGECSWYNELQRGNATLLDFRGKGIVSLNPHFLSLRRTSCVPFWAGPNNYHVVSERALLQECVKRRAILSVKMNPACSGPGQAEAAVEKAWEKCIADTEPFDRKDELIELPPSPFPLSRIPS